MKRYPHQCGPIEYINNTPYQIVARYSITEVKDAQGIKKWLGCDTVFKANRLNLFIFCNQIEEAEIVKLI
jgi:hypothetical protein|tara:strand:+ start:99 stop:308 length:210 start_codon:yes stop_codon:yes gene_type:complete